MAPNTNNYLNELYFDWMSRMSLNDDAIRNKYSKLLLYLNSITFTYIIPHDENRYEDGLYLKYRFADDYGIDTNIVEEELGMQNCTILEMMLALAIRCEDNITYDPDVGDRSSVWFFEMIKNLKLDSMTNENFDKNLIDYRIGCFLNRTYEPNGYGGLFTVRNPKRDMRTVEIWYQMCWYLDDILYNDF